MSYANLSTEGISGHVLGQMRGTARLLLRWGD